MENLISQIFKFILSLFQKQGVTYMPTAQEINWTDLKCKVSNHFTVKEMLWLPSWGRLANEQDGLTDEIKTNLVNLANQMDIVREYFNLPIHVHVTYRPVEYNKAIGGALHSYHSMGGAMDFDIVGMSCDDVRKQIVDNNMLETWQMRCEDMLHGNWIHLDIKPLSPGGNRYFKP